MDRLHRRSHLNDEKRKSAAANSSSGGDASADHEEKGPNRRVYFNIPIPESERDEEGFPNNNYPRNKIRTAKYSPITFVPMNIWFQFHNIANIYFLFVIILNVRNTFTFLLMVRLTFCHRFRPFLVPTIPVSTPSP